LQFGHELKHSSPSTANFPIQKEFFFNTEEEKEIEKIYTGKGKIIYIPV